VTAKCKVLAKEQLQTSRSLKLQLYWAATYNYVLSCINYYV